MRGQGWDGVSGGVGVRMGGGRGENDVGVEVGVEVRVWLAGSRGGGGLGGLHALT